MKGFLFLFMLYGTWAQAAAPGCQELESIVQDLEKTLQGKNLAAEECQDIKAADLLTEVPPTEGQTSLLDNFKCQNLSVIETRLKSIENEQALITGIETLKNEIQLQKDQTEVVASDPAVVAKAAQSFKDNLAIAQSLELVLNTTFDGNKNLLPEIGKVDLKNRETLKAFNQMIAKFCKDRGVVHPEEDVVDVCDPDFVPTQAAVDELNALVLVSKDTDKKLNATQVKDLQTALTIQKTDGTSYSFTEMRSDLHEGLAVDGDNNLTLSRQDLKVIQALPDFENPDSLSFLSGIKEAKTEIAKKLVTQRFKFLVEDLEKREQWEMDSKFSLIQLEYGKYFDETNYELCNSAPKSECLAALLKNPAVFGVEKAHLSKMAEEFQYSENYLKELKSSEDLCTKNPKALSPECESIITAKQAKLLEDAQALNALKQQILERNSELMTFRNFAVEKLDSQECVTREQTLVGECSEGFDASISPEASALMGNTMEIILVYTAPDEPTDISTLCDDGVEKIFKKERLCSFLTDETSDVIKTDNAPYQAPTSPAGGSSPVKDALLQGVGNLLTDMANTMAARNAAPPLNPYPTYAPVSGVPAMSISNKILNEARWNGYGYYVPTPGLPTYSTFGGLGTYNPYTGTGGSYFTYPTGY